MDLNELRVQIDNVDKEMVRLFEERMQIAKNIKEYKFDN